MYKNLFQLKALNTTQTLENERVDLTKQEQLNLVDVEQHRHVNDH